MTDLVEFQINFYYANDLRESIGVEAPDYLLALGIALGKVEQLNWPKVAPFRIEIRPVRH